jgi:dihydrodipicolinate synthase/N-acetylneuraminate lyase
MTISANVIEGVIVPLLTPVDENEQVDESAWMSPHSVPS